MSLIALIWTVCPISTRTLAAFGVTFPSAMVTNIVTSAVCEAGGGDGVELVLFTGIGETDDGAGDPVGSVASPAAQPAATRTSSTMRTARCASRLIAHRTCLIRTLSGLVTTLSPDTPTRVLSRLIADHHAVLWFL